MQNGSLMQTPSRRGPNVWEYRWRAGAGWEEIIGPITSLGRAAIAISTPAAAKAGIGKIGWHTFRHTYSTLLHALGTAPAVRKELLRHSDIQTTLNIYTQAVTSAKREAASKVADLLWRM